MTAASVESPKLGVMLLGHARPWLFSLIAEQATDIDPAARVHIALDRPTDAVVKAAEAAAATFPDNVRLLETPFPPLTHREQFIALRDWQLEQLRGDGAPEYACLWDDDHVLNDTVLARTALASQPGIVRANKLFFWDDLDHINVHMPQHLSGFFFRDTGANFAAISNVPDASHLIPKLIDVGYVLSDERRRVWEAYKRAGKIDPTTTPLVAPPQKVRWYADAAIRRRVAEAMGL